MGAKRRKEDESKGLHGEEAQKKEDEKKGVQHEEEAQKKERGQNRKETLQELVRSGGEEDESGAQVAVEEGERRKGERRAAGRKAGTK